jgi:preprotein translocase subunit SecA
MTQLTVRLLAKQVGLPVERLLVQLWESGLPHGDAQDPVNEKDRAQLLNHLQRLHRSDSNSGARPAKAVTVRRAKGSDPEATEQGSVREAATIEIRKRRTPRALSDTPASQDIASEALAALPSPSVFASDPQLEAAKRALLEEARRRNEVVDVSNRADTEAREEAELLTPKFAPKPKPKVAAKRVAQEPLKVLADVRSQAPVSAVVGQNEEMAARGPAKQPTARAIDVTDAGAEEPTEVAASKSANTRKVRQQRVARPSKTKVSKPSSGDERSATDVGAQDKASHAASDRTAHHQPKLPESRAQAAGVSKSDSTHWWTRTTKPSVALRPGILTGAYPEREDMRDSWLERTAASAAGLLRQHVGGGRPRYRHFVDQVHAAAQGFDELEDGKLSALVPPLRRRLYSEGFSDELVSQSFAIVREMATRRLGMRHYDVQLYGGWIMLNGMIAEMETGEGKTLTATLTAATGALAGIPVHVVTVNDFLVQRDAAWMQPLYRALGLRVGTIIEGMDLDQRREAYSCDITYCTNKQLVFDYLKDRLILGADNGRLHLQLETLHSEVPRTGQLLLRGLCFAIVDEADSVLVDEARTPLVISKSGDTAQLEKTYRDAIRAAKQLRGGRDFEVHTRERRVELSDAGRRGATALTRELKGVWSGARRRESLIRQALSAIHLFHLDKHYLINDGKVQIVDEYSGRVMADRSWEGGLHQMIQAKEGVEITGQQETLARISYQRFFRRYMRVAGMTGTAHEVARELWSVYRLNVVSVPTNRPVLRMRLADAVYTDAEHKWQAVVRDIRELHDKRQPVLVGTRSVGASEHLSELLHAARLDHVVLNARQDQHEAEVVAVAGQAGRITVATNMAGRGTDIRLAPDVAAYGGLHVLLTERHESGRIDRQLFGRGARQGDPGSYRCIVSLDDELVSDYWAESVLRLVRAISVRGRAPRWLGVTLVTLAQRAAEKSHGKTRRDLLRLDDNLGDMLAFSGRGE